MNSPYFYAAVQCRDVRAFDEVRTVGAVLLAPSRRFGALATIPLARKLADPAVDFVQGILGVWAAEVVDVARGSDADALAWLNAHAIGGEDLVRLSSPSVGLAEDPKRELARLKVELTGYQPRQARTPTAKVVADVLRANQLLKRFHPADLSSGNAAWRFALVDGPRVVHPVEFNQKEPAAMIDAAWRDSGRFREIRRRIPQLDPLVVTPRPTSTAAERAHDVYRESNVRIVLAERAAIEGALRLWGLVGGGAEAK